MDVCLCERNFMRYEIQMQKQQNNSNEYRSEAQGQYFPRNKLELTTKELKKEKKKNPKWK